MCSIINSWTSIENIIYNYVTLKILKKKSFSKVILKYLPIIVHIIFFAES